MTMKQIVKKIEKHRDKIGKERDALREILYEIEPLIESCDDAIRDLNYAIDRLSEYA